MRFTQKGGQSQIWLFVFLFLTLALLNTIRVGFRALDHDENLYIAAAWLLSKGYLPYKDFNFGHPPLQPLLMSIIMKFVSYKLLAFRITNSFLASAAITIMAYYLFNFGKHKQLNINLSFLFSICFALLFFFSTNFIYTSGVSWHHDLLLFLFTLSLIFFFKRNFFWSGIFLGLSVSTRLTSLFIFFGFIFWLFWQKREKLFSFLFGFIVGCLPLFVFFILSPIKFITLNIKRAEAIEAYLYFINKWHKVASIGGKLHRFKKAIIEPTVLPALIILLIFLLMLVRNKKSNLEIKIIGLLCPFTIISIFAPPPLWPQYLYPLIFLVFLLFTFSLIELASSYSNYSPKKSLLILCILCILLVSINLYYNSSKYYRSIQYFFKNPQSSLYIKVHTIGMNLAKISPPGKILTLCPLFPIEGDRFIYLYLADGPFSWRNSLVLKNPEKYGLLSPQKFLSYLNIDRPGGIFLGCEPSFLEKPFLVWATKNQYQPIDIPPFKVYIKNDHE